MKNKVKLLGIIALAAFFSFSFFCCKDEDENKLDSGLFATWYFDRAFQQPAFELTSDGKVYAIGYYDYEDNTYIPFDSYNNNYTHIDVSYTTDSGVITTIATSNQWDRTLEGTAKYSIDGKKLTLTEVESGDELLVFCHFVNENNDEEGEFYKK
jgi:hypothetical protein